MGLVTDMSFNLIGPVESGAGAVTVKPKPNVLLIMVDDMGVGDLSDYNAATIPATPNLDALAAAGQVYTNAVTDGCVCSPTRAALLTGLPATASNFTHVINGGSEVGIPPEFKTLPERMRDLGYTCHHVGKWHCGDDSQEIYDQVGVGFHYAKNAKNQYYYDSDMEYQTLGQLSTIDADQGAVHLCERLADYAIEIVQKEKTPWFLNLWMHAPHETSFADDGHFYESPTAYEAKYADSLDGRYAALVEYMDFELGRILDAVDALDEDTIIIFTSDNGAVDPATHGASYSNVEGAITLRGFKDTFYEGGIRVPLVIKSPSSFALGSASKRIAVSDIPYQLMYWLGGNLTNMQGQTFTDTSQRFVFHMGNGGQARSTNPNRNLYEFAIYDTDTQLKYVRERRDEVVGLGLYDLSADPTETTDISGSTDPQYLLDALYQWRRTYHELPFNVIDDQFVLDAAQRLINITNVTELAFDTRMNFHDRDFFFTFEVRWDTSLVAKTPLVQKPNSWVLSVNPDETLTLDFGASSVTTSSPITLGVYTRVVISFTGWPSDGTDAHIWIDGTEVATLEASDFPATSTDSIEIGHVDPTGRIRDFRMYNTHTTDVEVQDEGDWSLV